MIKDSLIKGLIIVYQKLANWNYFQIFFIKIFEVKKKNISV